MPALHDLQSAVAAFVLNGDERASVLVQGDGLSVEQRLSIHRNTTMMTLREALSAVYPVVHRLVGDDFFAEMARDYMGAHPPSQRSLIHYGETFPTFVAAYAPAQSLAYLADVAQLEWAWHTAFHGADAVAISLAALEGLSPDAVERVRLFFHPTAQLLHSRYPVHRIWQVNQDDPGSIDPVRLDEGAAPLLVTRPRLDVELHVLTPDAFAFVQSLLAAAPLGDACVAGLESDPAFEPGVVLARLFEAGVIVGFVVETKTLKTEEGSF